MYVDAAFCYRWSSVVCRSVSRSVRPSVTVVSHAKTAEPIEMPFRMLSGVGPENEMPRWFATELNMAHG